MATHMSDTGKGRAGECRTDEKDVLEGRARADSTGEKDVLAGDPAASEVQEFARLGRNVRLPRRTQESVLSAARAIREEREAQAAAGGAAQAAAGPAARTAAGPAAQAAVGRAARTAVGTRSRRPVSHPLTRRGLIRLAVGAAGVGAVFAIGSVYRRGGDVVGAAKDGFALRAYANGLPQGDGSSVLAGLGSGGSVSEGEDGWWMVACDMDLSCTGADIRRLTFELLDGYADAEAGGAQQRALAFVQESHQDVGPGEDVPYYQNTQFSVDYDEQGKDELLPYYLTRKTVAWFPATDEITSLSDETREMDPGAELDAKWHRLMALCVQEFATMLAQSRLRVTAELSDGTTQAHTYAVAPVDDFVARYEDFEVRREQVAASDPGDGAGTGDGTGGGSGSADYPPLYLITQVE